MSSIKKEAEECKEFLLSHPLEELDTLSDETKQQILQSIPNGRVKNEVLARLHSSLREHEAIATQQIVSLTQKDIDFLHNITAPKLKRLFYCFLVWARLYPHKSNYIKFDLAKVKAIAFSSSEASTITADDIQNCLALGIDMRVVGSKTALPCFCLPEELRESEPAILTFNRSETLNIYNTLKEAPHE